MTIEIDVPEEMAKTIQSLSREQVNSYALAGLWRGILASSPRPVTFGELMDAGWVPPTVEGRPRADGRPWSEIEAACDAGDDEVAVDSGR